MGLTWQEKAAARAAGDGGRPKIRWRRWALLATTGLVAALIPALPGSANHASSITGVFESDDGNLDVAANHAGAVDWNSFWNTGTNSITATGTSYNFQKFGDNIGNPDDIYGGGTKQDANCPATKAAGSLGGGSGKIDLSRIYLAHQAIDNPTDNPDLGVQDYLFVAWGRVDGSDAASSHVAYEFNRGDVACSNGNGLVNRIADDVLIVYDFSGGDADATFKVLRWITTGTTGCEVENHTPPCWGNKLVLNGSNADGDVNAGVSVFDGIRNDTLGPVQFGEAALNLTAAGIDPCDLNGTVTGVSRSSGDSGSAQMKDKVGPGAFSLPGCTQATTITTLMRLSDKATIQGFDSTFIGDHTGTLTFTLWGPNNASCTGTPVYTDVHNNVATGGPFVTTSGGGFYEVPVNQEGVYRWKVVYSGDSANDPSESGCGAETVTVDYS